MERFFPVIRAFSLVLFFFGLTLLIPLTYSLWIGDGAAYVYDEGLLAAVSVALLLWWPTRRHRQGLKLRDGFLMVVMIWIVLPLFASIPLFAWFYPALSFTDAYFEATSGLTATGATVLSGLDALPPSINLWRGLMVWLGGMGLVVLAVAVLPMLGIGGRQMFKAETPGPMKDSKLTPRINQTAKGLWGVYLAITLACGLAYYGAGMTPFDALMHSFTTVGLGGFSSHDASFGYWNSPLLEAIAIFFMILAGINFATHFLAFSGRSLRPYRGDPEARWYLAVLAASSLAVAVYLYEHQVFASFGESIRHAVFNTVSVATTTGYANLDYGLWPLWAPLWMLFLGSFSTSAGSTGGGIKMMRAIILYKQVYRELIRSIHPNAVVPVRLGSENVSSAIMFSVLAFAFAYMCLTVALTLVMAFSGLDILTGFSAVVASLNNIGPGLNHVGPATTFAALTDFQTWVCTLAMLLGRLEIFSLLVVLTPEFWRR